MSRQIGNVAEQQAKTYLQQHGMHILTCNYTCRNGEIDIIGQDKDTLVFVEVRRRSQHQAAADSIDEFKQQRIMLAAEQYLAALGDEPICRFDAVLVDEAGEICWLKDAFWAD